MMDGSVAETIDGVAVVALAILRLAGVAPQYMVFIAAIVFGVALLNDMASGKPMRLQPC